MREVFESLHGKTGEPMSRYRVLFADYIRSEIGGGYFVLARLVNFFSIHPELGVKPYVLINNVEEFVDSFISDRVTWIPFTLPKRVVSLRRSLGAISLIRGVLVIPLLAGVIWHLVNICRRYRINIVHANGITSFIILSIVAKITGVRLIYHLHDALLTAEDGGTMSYPTRRLLLFWMKCFADKIVTVSLFVERTITTLHRRLRRKITVLHNGLDIRQIRQDSPKRYAGGDPFIVSFGTLSPRKGFHVVLRSIEVLRDRYGIRARYRIIGDGAELPFLEKLIDEKNLRDQVEILGFQSNVHHYVAQADIILVPSVWNDPLPLVVIESMANSKIIIASEVGGIPEMLSNNDGFLIPKEDPEAIARAVIYIMNHSEQANSLADNAYERVCREFTIERMASRLREIYEEVLL